MVREEYDSTPAEHGDTPPHRRWRAWCGTTGRMDWKWNFTRDAGSIGCSDCGKLFWADRLAQTGLAVERIELKSKANYSDPERPSAKYDTDTRSLFRVMRGEDHVAWIYLVPGYGAGWQMSRHGFKRDQDVMAATVANVVPSVHFKDRGFRFRDEAACWLWEHSTGVKADKDVMDALVSPTAYLARSQHQERVWEERKAKMAEREAAERSEAAEAMLQLIDLVKRQDLTNYQRAGLEWAMAQFDSTGQPR